MNNLENSLLLVSGGVDSMSLLHFFIKEKISCAVLHINHQTRGADNEIEYLMIKNICESNKIKLYYEKYNHQIGNFQGQARKFRYELACDLSKKKNYSQIVTAHHRDDLVENILMYENKVSSRMIQSKTEYNGIVIYRPLLKYYKAQIYQYAKENEVHYNEDESNQKLTYLRNKYRHNVIAQLSIAEKEEIINAETKRISMMPTVITNLNVNYIQKFKLDEQLYIVDKWLRLQGVNCVSKKTLKQICSTMENNGSKQYQLAANKKLVINYGEFKVFDLNISYDEKFKKLKKGINYFNGIEFTCSEDGLYATCRKPGDKIEINGINKRISRLMIEYKIDQNLRDYWPIICTKERKLVYLPKKIKK